MKKITLLSLSICAVLSASQELEKIKSLSMFSNPNIKIIGYQESASTYQVKAIVDNQGQISSFEAFITKDLEEIIIGKGFNAKTQTPLKVSINMKEHLNKAAYAIGEGKDEYLLFTDPECPYCQKLEKLLPSLAKHAKFHVFLYSLSFHKNAKQMSYHILSQKSVDKRREAMHQIANGSNSYNTTKFSVEEMTNLDKQLQEQIRVASLLGVNGTPAVFSVEGHDVQWMGLLEKYNIQEPIDMQGIIFLKNNDLQIRLSDANSKKTLHVFSSLSHETSLKQLNKVIKKYGKTTSIFLYLVAKAEDKKSVNQTKAIYYQKSNKDRVALITQLLKNQLSDEKILQESSKMSKDEETKYLPVYYIMQRMKLDINKELVIINESGDIVSDETL